MADEQPSSSWESSGLTKFVAPELDPDEQVRAILTKTTITPGEFRILAEFIVELARLSLDHFSTRRAIVVTDRRVFIVRTPWRGPRSIERVSNLTEVIVEVFRPSKSSASGLLFTRGLLRLRFPAAGLEAFHITDEGDFLNAEAEAVVEALGGPSRE